jgi:hypothetical protein
MRFVNFFEFVSGAGAVTFAFGEFDIGIVDVVVQPSFVDFSTLGFNFQTEPSFISFIARHYPL